MVLRHRRAHSSWRRIVWLAVNFAAADRHLQAHPQREYQEQRLSTEVSLSKSMLVARPYPLLLLYLSDICCLFLIWPS